MQQLRTTTDSVRNERKNILDRCHMLRSEIDQVFPRAAADEVLLGKELTNVASRGREMELEIGTLQGDVQKLEGNLLEVKNKREQVTAEEGAHLSQHAVLRDTAARTVQSRAALVEQFDTAKEQRGHLLDSIKEGVHEMSARIEAGQRLWKNAGNIIGNELYCWQIMLNKLTYEERREQRRVGRRGRSVASFMSWEL